MPSTVSLRHLTKRFSGGHGSEGSTLAVDGVDLDLTENELVVMVGPSGCGKSTILRMIAGLEEPTSGEVIIDGQRVDGVPTRIRNVGFMFQGYALFEHLTVAENIGFGLKTKKTPEAVRLNRTGEMVSLMGLGGLEDSRPAQLSNGQQQRVALARALAPWPRLLLLDEPFAAVGAEVGQKLRADMRRLQRELGIPTLLVTRNQRDALELGDRVAVMSDGRFEQVDTPRNVYNSPATEFVGRFIGGASVFHRDGESRDEPRNNLFEAMVRPEDIAIFPRKKEVPQEDGGLPATIVGYEFLDRTVRLEVELESRKVVTVALPEQETLANDLKPGTAVTLVGDAIPLLENTRNGSRRTERGTGAEDGLQPRSRKSYRYTPR